MSTSQVKLPVLSREASQAFDEYVRARDKKRKCDAASRKAGEERGRHQAVVLEAMDGAKVARLDDGRLVQRKEHERKLPAKPAHTQSWESLEEVEL